MWIVNLIIVGFRAITSLFGWLQSNRDVDAGKTQQKLTDAEVSLGIQQREDKAANNAPKTTEELQDELEKGKF